MSNLKLNNFSNNGNNDSEQVLKGAYVSEATVVSAEDKSKTEIFGSTYDLAVELTLEIGKEFQPKKIFKGNFKRDENGNIIGWGSAMAVNMLFQRTGCYGLFSPLEQDELVEAMEQSRISSSLLKVITGKKFFKLDYVSGLKPDGVKMKYASFGNIHTNKEKLTKEFLTSIEKGYTKSYKPELLDKETTFTPPKEEDPI